jgi:hypothetical protein
MVCRVCQPTRVARPSASVDGEVTISVAAAAPTSTMPAPWEVTASSASGLALDTRRLLSASASREGRAWASNAAAPATVAAAALVPFTVP